jgi:hypothetical protein
MLHTLQISTLILVTVAMVPALAHALELPGKLRLAKDAYRAVQPIYYPGFTIAGIAEPVAIIATVVLLVLTPAASPDWWLTLAALVGLVGMHLTYWVVTHPVNDFWLQGEDLGDLGSAFFGAGSEAGGGRRGLQSAAWTQLRDRWEYSHVARAVLAAASFIALASALPNG